MALTVPDTARLRAREVELPPEEHVGDGAGLAGVAEDHCLVLGVLQKGAPRAQPRVARSRGCVTLAETAVSMEKRTIPVVLPVAWRYETEATGTATGARLPWRSSARCASITAPGDGRACTDARTRYHAGPIGRFSHGFCMQYSKVPKPKFTKT